MGTGGESVVVMRAVMTIALATTVAGCTAPATVYLDDGRVLERVIKGSDKDYIYVGVEKVERSRIKEIDHPGNGIGIAGIVIDAIFGLTGVATGADFIASGGENELSALGMGFSLTMVALGTFMAVWGFYLHNKSVEAARPPREGEVKPVVFYDGERGYAGLVLSW